MSGQVAPKRRRAGTVPKTLPFGEQVWYRPDEARPVVLLKE